MRHPPVEHADPGARRGRRGGHLLSEPDGGAGVHRRSGGQGRHWLVDGTNVVGSRPDGWWRDRPAAFARLVERLQALVTATGDEVTVVFDGRPAEALAEGDHGGVAVRWATRRGPDAADDRIVDLLAAGDGNEPAGAITVVTSDRALAGRAREHGAEVEGAGAFLARLRSLSL